MTTLATRYTMTTAHDADTNLCIDWQCFDVDEITEVGVRSSGWVWGNGVQTEQRMNEVSDVISFDEIGSAAADLDEIADAISDRVFCRWIATLNEGQPGGYRAPKTKLQCAREVCEEYVLNTIESATGVVDITADVVADLREKEEERASYDLYLVIAKTAHGTVYEVPTTDSDAITDYVTRTVGPATVGPDGYPNDAEAILALRLTDEYTDAREEVVSA